MLRTLSAELPHGPRRRLDDFQGLISRALIGTFLTASIGDHSAVWSASETWLRIFVQHIHPLDGAHCCIHRNLNRHAVANDHLHRLPSANSFPRPLSVSPLERHHRD